eukprot:GHVH01007481.1.p1 GENE.GHVH01007481.1~~GHVH01007481.1.p1  ORF type:complete len:648 (-),score=82.49 GHVH01007481.1:154-2097(-)
MKTARWWILFIWLQLIYSANTNDSNTQVTTTVAIDALQDSTEILTDTDEATCIETAEKSLSGKNLIVELLRCGRHHSLPPFNDKGTVVLGISLNLIKVIGILDNGTFKLSVMMRVNWRDDRLVYIGNRYLLNWDSASDYVEMLPATARGENIWIPDIYPVTGVMSNTEENENWLFQPIIYDHFFMKAKGWNVQWDRLLTLNSMCSFFFENFPLDAQICRIVFSTWQSQTTNRNQTIYRPMSFGYDLAYSFRDDISDVSSFTIKGSMLNVEYNNNSQESNYVAYTFRLNRKSQPFINNFVWPCQILLLIAYASLWLPSYWYDRVSMTVTLLLSIFQIMGVTAEERPPFGFDTWIDNYISYIVVLCLIPALEIIIMNALCDAVGKNILDEEKRERWMKYYLSKNASDARKVRMKLYLKEGMTSNYGIVDDYDVLFPISYTNEASYTNSVVQAPKESDVETIWSVVKRAFRLACMDTFPSLMKKTNKASLPDPWTIDTYIGHWNTNLLVPSKMDFLHHVNFDEFLLQAESDYVNMKLEWHKKKVANLIDSLTMVIYPGLICALLMHCYSVFSDIELLYQLFAGNASIFIFSSCTIFVFFSLWSWGMYSHFMLVVSDHHDNPIGVGERSFRRNLVSDDLCLSDDSRLPLIF